MSDLKKLYIDVDKIIKLAEKFRCCPICGFEDAQKQYCKKCKQKYNERETSFFFSAYLRKIKNRGDFDGFSETRKQSKNICEQ